jgi:hypothetical protein
MLTVATLSIALVASLLYAFASRRRTLARSRARR